MQGSPDSNSPSTPSRSSVDKESLVGLKFTERMTGTLSPSSGRECNADTREPKDLGYAGVSQNSNFTFIVTVGIPNLESFCRDPDLRADLTGKVEAQLEATWDSSIENGTFNLFTRQLVSASLNAEKEMHYHFYFEDSKGQIFTFFGYKEIDKEDMAEIWKQTTSLYSYIWKARIPLEEVLLNKQILFDKAEYKGLLKILPEDFLHQLTTFEVTPPGLASKARALSTFLNLFAGNLWQASAPAIFGTTNYRWNEHIFPLQSTEGVSQAEITNIDFTTKDGLALSFHRFCRATSRRVVLLLHGLSTSTDMFIMPEHYNLVSYLHNNGFTDVWSLDWRGSNRYFYNLEPHRYTIDHVAKYDIPAAVNCLRSKLGSEVEVHVVCHCVGSLAFMASLGGGFVQGITSVVSNSVSFHPRITWQSKLKILFGPDVFEHLFGYPYVSPKMPYFPGPGFGKWIYYMERALRKECKEPACHMVSFLWGWGFPAAFEHKNLHPLTHRRLMDLFGGVSFHYFRHIRKMVWAGESVPFKEDSTVGDLPENYFQGFLKNTQNPSILFISGDQNKIFTDSNKTTFEQLIKLGLSPNQYQYLSCPGYGHQDVLMGQYNHGDVFPKLIQFMNQHSHYRSEGMTAGASS